jgi:serine/threonine protein kinase
MVINNYTLIQAIGQGGMATVYIAEHTILQKSVAIKLLNKDYLHNENIRKRFLAEARNLFGMSHPNIIKVTDLIDDGDTVAFVMEYIEGETLKEFLDRKGKLSDDEIKNFFSQMLEAVGYVHEQNLVHRDIKPSNFMITLKGQIKLLDFGIAKNTDTNSADYTQTGTNQNMGTPIYMSPEQIKSTKDVTLQSDIYSLGVVLWQMVMGKKPYDTETSSNFDLQTKIVNEKLPIANSIFNIIIEKATAKNLENRYKNCNEVKVKFDNLQKEDNENTKAYTSKNHEKTIIETVADQTIIENKKEQTDFQKLIIDQFFPAKVKSHFHKLYFELGLDIYSDIIAPISLDTSFEYDLIYFEGLYPDFGCFSFKINKIEFLLGVYMHKWCLIFNNHHYLYFKEIKQLNRCNDLNLSDNIVALIIEMVNRFIRHECYNKLDEYITYAITKEEKKYDKTIFKNKEEAKIIENNKTQSITTKEIMQATNSVFFNSINNFNLGNPNDILNYSNKNNSSLLIVWIDDENVYYAPTDNHKNGFFIAINPFIGFISQTKIIDFFKSIKDWTIKQYLFIDSAIALGIKNEIIYNSGKYFYKYFFSYKDNLRNINIVLGDGVIESNQD